MLVHRCAERGCNLTEDDVKNKKKCPTCRHPLNVVTEEVPDAPAPTDSKPEGEHRGSQEDA